MTDGQAIRAARTTRRWSQTDLIAAMRHEAVRTGFTLMSPSSLRIAVSRWENGRHTPDQHYTRLLEAVLPELGEQQVAEKTGGDDTGSVSRDSLHDVLAAHIDSCRALDRRFGAPAARGQTTAHVESLETLWHSTLGADRRTVAYALAEAATLAAWQDLDIGDLDSARTHYAAAKRAARRAEDPVRLSHTMGEEAIMLAESGRPRAARDHVEAALAIPGLPTSLRSWLWATKAQVLADAEGDARSARRALGWAERLLSHAQNEDSAQLPFLCHDPVHFARWSGHILTRLCDPGAGQVTRDALAVLPRDFVRARAGQHLDLAQDALNGHRHEEAAAILTGCGASIDALGSVRLRRRHQFLSGRVRCPARAE